MEFIFRFLTNAFVLVIIWGVFVFALYLGNVHFLEEIAYTRDRENAAETWPSVIGKISASEVRVSRAGRRHGTTQFPHVSYTYEVNGKAYHSSNIMAGGEIGGVNVESTLARYPNGSEVTVYYNPQKPNDAVLQPGDKTMSKVLRALMVFMNVAIIAVGLYITFSILK